MPTEFTYENARATAERAGEIEYGPPSPQAEALLAKCYAWLDLARQAGVDVDAVIAEVCG